MDNLNDLLIEAQRLGIHGLLFQHITLCPTRTWFHYHRIDCAHLNRHMQAGLLVHETAYGGTQVYFGFGLSPDRLDFKHREVNEVKNSRAYEPATIAQLMFYVAVMQQASHQSWTGVLRYPNSRRTKRLLMNATKEMELFTQFKHIKAVIQQPRPQQQVLQKICTHCSYRLLCWGLSTEDEDY